MEPVTYKGHSILCEMYGDAKDADGRSAARYKVSIDGEEAFTFVPLGPGVTYFIETAQDMIDERIDERIDEMEAPL